MKILLIDKHGFQLQARQSLLEEALRETIDTVSTVGELFVAYQKAKYDVIIIDHNIENGAQFIENILSIDPMQQILVVSDAINCVIRRCEDCTNNHRIRRLYNPTPIGNIIRMVEGFNRYSCDHYDSETNKIRG